MMIGDKRRINNQDRAASGPPEKGDRKMDYYITLLRLGNETIPGSDVMNVLYPDKEDPVWLIQLKDGTEIRTTHPVTVIEKPDWAR
jgi:hypothetical protein